MRQEKAARDPWHASHVSIYKETCVWNDKNLSLKILTQILTARSKKLLICVLSEGQVTELADFYTVYLSCTIVSCLHIFIVKLDSECLFPALTLHSVVQSSLCLWSLTLASGSKSQNALWNAITAGIGIKDKDKRGILIDPRSPEEILADDLPSVDTPDAMEKTAIRFGGQYTSYIHLSLCVSSCWIDTSVWDGWKFPLAPSSLNCRNFSFLKGTAKSQTWERTCYGKGVYLL